MRSEGVQQVAVAAWGLWVSSLVPRRSVLSRLDYYVSVQVILLGTAKARGEVAGMCPLLTLPACSSTSTTPVWLVGKSQPYRFRC